jgi:hypothetical protein
MIFRMLRWFWLISNPMGGIEVAKSRCSYMEQRLFFNSMKKTIYLRRRRAARPARASRESVAVVGSGTTGVLKVIVVTGT